MSDKECNICMELCEKLIQCHLGCSYKMCSKCYLRTISIKEFSVTFKCPQCRRVDKQILWGVPKRPLNIILESDIYLDTTISNNIIQEYINHIII